LILDNSQFAPKCFGHFADRVNVGIATFSQRFIQACPGDTGLFGYFRHALCSGCNVKGMDKVGLIAGGSHFSEEATNIFVGVQMFGDVVLKRGRLKGDVGSKTTCLMSCRRRSGIG
jgi:hypothetical protein